MKYLDLSEGFMMLGHYPFNEEFLIKVGKSLYIIAVAKTRVTDENGTEYTRFFIKS